MWGVDAIRDGAGADVDETGVTVSAVLVATVADDTADPGCPTGASTIARMTLSDSPAAFKFFSADVVVSNLHGLDLILATSTSAESPAPDISKMSLFVKKLTLAAGADGCTESIGWGARATPVLVIDDTEASALQGT